MKRIISTLLAAVLIINSMIFTAAASDTLPRDLTSNEKMAGDLKELGLFRGVSATDFDLDRAPSRTEALVILIRLLGKEAEALNGSYEHPFTDVAEWANRYVGFAYETGLTKGISETEFGTSDANAATFLTFVLRALGYSDAAGLDFTWDNPFELAKKIGVLTGDVDTENFWRADAVTVSYNALSAKLKGTNGTLAKKLIADGAFTEEQYNAVFGIEDAPTTDTQDDVPEVPEVTPPTEPTETEQSEETAAPQYEIVAPEDEKIPYSPKPIAKISTPKKALTAKEAYEKCSPFVFSINTYDVGGNPYGTASGFLLNTDGLAVTNMHVFYDALSANATFKDGTAYEVEGIVGVDPNNDCVLIKLKGSNFPKPSLGDSDKIETGDAIFTIGNPRGLSETISTGIISSVSREDYSGWIQITAPISKGSSGGALINEYGQVIGITAGTLADSQNLNFAVPINVAYDLYKKVSEIDEPYMITFDMLAWMIECIRMTSLTKPFSSYYNEAEPNNTPEEAGVLPNSRSVLGTVSSSDSDSYLIRCSCDGTVTVLLMSPTMVIAMGNEDAKGRKMSDFKIELRDPKTGEVISTSEVIKDDSSGIELVSFSEIPVPAPGIYELRVFVKDTAPKISEGSAVIYDYMLYALFVPDVNRYANKIG